MLPKANDYDEAQRVSHFNNYADYSRTLRAWLVAYGIGGPVLFVTNEKVTERIAKSGYANEIIVLFLLGVALQIILATINKWGAWHMYRGAGDAKYCRTWRYKLWGFINEQSWIDFVIDLWSLLMFMLATWRVLNVLLRTAA